MFILLISLPNPMFDHLLESSHRDDSNKWSNIEFSEETMKIESIEVSFTHLIWSSVVTRMVTYTKLPNNFQIGWKWQSRRLTSILPCKLGVKLPLLKIVRLNLNNFTNFLWKLFFRPHCSMGTYPINWEWNKFLSWDMLSYKKGCLNNFISWICPSRPIKKLIKYLQIMWVSVNRLLIYSRLSISRSL